MCHEDPVRAESVGRDDLKVAGATDERRKLQTTGTAEEHKRQETPTTQTTVNRHTSQTKHRMSSAGGAVVGHNCGRTSCLSWRWNVWWHSWVVTA